MMSTTPASEDAYECATTGCPNTTWLCRHSEQWCAKAQGAWTKGAVGSLRVWCQHCCAEHYYERPSMQTLRQNCSCRHAPPPAHSLAPPAPPVQPAAAHAPTPTPAMRLWALEQRIVEMGGVQQSLFKIISDIETRRQIKESEMESQLRKAEDLNNIAISKGEYDMSKLMSWTRDNVREINDAILQMGETSRGMDDALLEMGEKVGGMEDAINQMKEKVREKVGEQDPTSSLDPAASLQSSGSGSSWVAEGSEVIEASR